MKTRNRVVVEPHGNSAVGRSVEGAASRRTWLNHLRTTAAAAAAAADDLLQIHRDYDSWSFVANVEENNTEKGTQNQDTMKNESVAFVSCAKPNSSFQSTPLGLKRGTWGKMRENVGTLGNAEVQNVLKIVY